MPIVKLPSGLEGEIRRLKVKDENILANRRAANDGTMGSKLLSNIWEKTISPGPYSFPNGFDPDILLTGDRFDLFRQLRILSYPGQEDYEFNLVCPACQNPFSWSVDLREAEIKPLSPESFERIKENKPFETVLPDCGKKVTYRLFTGREERRLPKLLQQSSDQLSSEQLILQIVEIEGIKDLRGYIMEEMSSYDAIFFRQEIEDNDCGVETTIGIQCPLCSNVFDFDMPFGAGFIFPGQVNGTLRSGSSGKSKKKLY